MSGKTIGGAGLIEMQERKKSMQRENAIIECMHVWKCQITKLLRETKMSKTLPTEKFIPYL